MRISDLTYPITQDMPLYPGTEQPLIVTGCSIKETGFLEKKITMYSHTGTHVNAPAHLLKVGKTLDMLPLNHFFGKAFLVNLENLDNETIHLKDLEPYRDSISQVKFVLI